MGKFAPLQVFAITSAMFKDRPSHPEIDRALADLNLTMVWDPKLINADVIVLHNPACLKFNTSFAPKLVCDTLVVVTHENFTTPAGKLGFDVDNCLDLIDGQTLAAHKILAPVSAYNRETVAAWQPDDSDWVLSDLSWSNICDFDQSPPKSQPEDRRGRHSRPGFEKFPDRATMDVLYPAHAAHNAILGADIFIDDDPPRHWTLFKFREMAVDHFLESLDFFVYFTNPNWRESFGRVIGEAIAAGKLVLTDPQTAKTFGNGVIGLNPGDVDACIAKHIADPGLYARTIRRAQTSLGQFSADRFRERAATIIDTAGGTR